MRECVWKTIHYMGDCLDLIEAFRDEPYFFFLDSSLKDSDKGRYSFIGFDPFYVFQSKQKDALGLLKKKYYSFQSDKNLSPVPFSAGIVGFVSYDYGLYQEKIPMQSVDDLDLPLCHFGFYDSVIAIDHVANRLYVTSTGLPLKQSVLRQRQAIKKLDYLVGRVQEAISKQEDDLSDGFVAPAAIKPTVDPPSADFAEESMKYHGRESMELPFQKNFTKEQYLQAVQKALHYIGEGDIYQVNLSQRFSLDITRDTFNLHNLYHVLRSMSPSCFGVYLDCNDFQILSSSPERFLRRRNNIVQTIPMKGTRPRGGTVAEDIDLKTELLSSAKDKAELLMITDLLRNDLGRVCDYNSIFVKEMRSIEQYSTVYQATSTIEGILQKGKDNFDLLEACFPGGSITGCPKIRAMEIIEELEPTRRGIYTGSLGYMDFSSDMDFNIIIRTILVKDQKLYFQVGGGIVADSIPLEEYQETLVKGKAIVDGISKELAGAPVKNCGPVA